LEIKPRPKFVLGILYNNEGIYLSKWIDPTKDMYKLWQTVCGKVELGESSIRAMEREISEESGLMIDRTEIIYMFNDPKYNCDIYKIKLKLEIPQ
jgi:8-oxo-dGTP pyrophosphatase MutT (NUDIX family)